MNLEFYIGLFLFSYSMKKNELLLQKRAANKYHSSSLWSNTCCSHLKLNESMETAASLRMNFEMGIICDLKFIKKFSYNILLENNLIQNEIDYIYFGWSNKNPKINPNEVSDYIWMNVTELIDEIKKDHTKFTYWLTRIVLNEGVLTNHSVVEQ